MLEKTIIVVRDVTEIWVMPCMGGEEAREVERNVNVKGRDRRNVADEWWMRTGDREDPAVEG